MANSKYCRDKPAARRRSNSVDPVGDATVRDFKKGDFLRLSHNKGSKIYIRGDYDRGSGKYHLIDTSDVYGNGRMVKGSTPANDNFTY